MSSRDDLLAFLRDLLQTRYRRHLADGFRDADARRETLLDVEVWTKAIDEGFLEFVEWLPAAGTEEPDSDRRTSAPAGEQLTLV